MVEPRRIPVPVPCGGKMAIDAFDEDGNPVRYEIEAKARAAPSSGGGGAGGAGGAPSGGGGGSGDHQPGDPDEVPRLPGEVGDPIAATVVVMDSDDDEQQGWSDSDLFVNRRILAHLPPGARRDAMVWNVGGFKKGQTTLKLPEGMGDAAGGAMMFVIGMEMPETP